MTEHSLWRFSRALHSAINERQIKDLEDVIDEDVDWAIYGPIEMFPFLGARRGKPAVLEVIRQIADNFRVHRFDREAIMLGADSAASMLRYSLTALDTNKPISLRVAHFAQFKAGRLASIRVLLDTFDLWSRCSGVPSICRESPRGRERGSVIPGRCNALRCAIAHRRSGADAHPGTTARGRRTLPTRATRPDSSTAGKRDSLPTKLAGQARPIP